MKAMMAITKLLATMFMFVAILAGCVAALLMLIVLVRFPLLLLPVLLTCWVVSGLQNSPEKSFP
ncbi:hypothetical protein [Pseudomonas sp.]|uniref:hypothetical protein n=1 Tax=Pseudomonas sp. TaxID=306 RepID=UPI00289B8352|nr:hypothetical protein [Pseudomonas sp.]